MFAAAEVFSRLVEELKVVIISSRQQQRAANCNDQAAVQRIPSFELFRQPERWHMRVSFCRSAEGCKERTTLQNRAGCLEPPSHFDSLKGRIFVTSQTNGIGRSHAQENSHIYWSFCN